MLFINGRFLTQSETGVQNYALQICRDLKSNHIPFTLLIPKKSEYENHEFDESILAIGNYTGHKWEQFNLRAFMHKRKNDLLLNLCNTAPLGIKNQIITLHDLAFLKNENWFSFAFKKWYSFLIPRIAKTSQHVITVSESIAHEIESTLTIPNEKITVVPNKICENKVPSASSSGKIENHISDSYFLMVGSQNPRKNFAFAEKVFLNRRKEKLLIVGGQNAHFKDEASIDSEYIHRIGYVTTAELETLYKNSIAVIHPSLYEGFGIPLLEAFAYNCPVICSDIPVFKEVCQEAAIYFNPTQPKELEKALELLKGQRKEMIKVGKNRLSYYQSIDRAKLIKTLIA